MSNVALNADYQRAVERANLKRQVTQMLASLQADDRRQLLLDVLAESSTAIAVERRDSSRGAAPPAGAPPGGRTSSSTAKPAAKAARRGRPKRRGKSGPAGRTEEVLRLLREQPRIPIAELAMHVYGESSTESNSKTRSLLHALKKQEKVRSVAPGQWEAT